MTKVSPQQQGSRQEWAVLFCTVTALLLLPSRTRDFAVRFHTQPLVIQTSKTSPPRLAFQEILDRQPAPPTELAWPENRRVNLNQFLAQGSFIHGLKALQVKKVILPALQVPREMALKSVQDDQWMQRLSEGERRRLEIANIQSHTSDEDWNLPTWKEQVHEKLKQIAAEESPASESKVFVQGTSPDGTRQTADEFHSSVGVETRTESRDDGTQMVTGDLTLHETAFLPGSHFEVNYFKDGISQASGKIQNGHFTLPVRRGGGGSVVAKLIDKDGHEMGRGEARLSSFGDSTAQFKNLAMSVRPRTNVTRAAESFYTADSGNMMKVSRSYKSPHPEVLVSAFGNSVQTDDDGILKAEGIAEGSWTFLRTREKGYYPSLQLATAGSEKAMPLFPKEMMKALIEITRGFQGAGTGGSTGAVIWGQILSGAKGISGARVEIEGFPGAKAIYFNSTLLIPDEKAKATSQNGYFAFVDLPPGFYSLRALQGAKQVSIANLEVDNDTVSPVQMVADALHEQVPVKIFDGFTGEAAAADVEFQHLPEELHINGFANVDVPQDETLSLVQVNPTNQLFAPNVQVFSSQQDHFHLPLVRKDWLLSIRAAKRIPDDPGTGTILGFVPADEYEIELPHMPQTSHATIVYFDAQGQMADHGVAGGGFIVFNTPSGSHTVSLLPTKSDLLHARVIPVDPGSLNILKFEF